jgi:endogenous inhibitor of DNA gyrase (YacG/DUF329 family)
VTPPPGKPERPAASRCPNCGKPTVKPHRPFCSKRCAQVDLGRWLKGHYAIAGEPSGEIDDRVDDELN